MRAIDANCSHPVKPSRSEQDGAIVCGRSKTAPSKPANARTKEQMTRALNRKRFRDARLQHRIDGRREIVDVQ